LIELSVTEEAEFEAEEVESPLDRLSVEEKTDYTEYLRSSVRAQRDAEVLGHRNYSR
jgi:hypothetical protein